MMQRTRDATCPEQIDSSNEICFAKEEWRSFSVYKQNRQSCHISDVQILLYRITMAGRRHPFSFMRSDCDLQMRATEWGNKEKLNSPIELLDDRTRTAWSISSGFRPVVCCKNQIACNRAHRARYLIRNLMKGSFMKFRRYPYLGCALFGFSVL